MQSSLASAALCRVSFRFSLSMLFQSVFGESHILQTKEGALIRSSCI